MNEQKAEVARQTAVPVGVPPGHPWTPREEDFLETEVMRSNLKGV